MGLRDRIRERAARRQAEKNAKKGTGVSTSGNIRKERSPGMSGDTGPTKREPQKTVKVTKKTVTPVTPASKVKKPTKSNQKAPETAAEFRARKAAELKAAKDKLVTKQKKVTADRVKVAKDKDTEKAMNTYKPGKALGTPKTTKRPKVTSDNKKSQADIAASNKRATFNRTNKTNAKPGDTYKYKKTDGTIITIEKGGSTKHAGKGKQIK